MTEIKLQVKSPVLMRWGSWHNTADRTKLESFKAQHPPSKKTIIIGLRRKKKKKMAEVIQLINWIYAKLKGSGHTSWLTANNIGLSPNIWQLHHGMWISYFTFNSWGNIKITYPLLKCVCVRIDCSIL